MTPSSHGHCCPHGAEGERSGLVLLPRQPAHSNCKLCPGLKEMLFQEVS